MFRLFIIFIILNIYKPALSSSKESVILLMENTNNLSFNFVQTIDDKKEKGQCIIQYPKKIFCKYLGSKKKIIISNGKSLVIKNTNKGGYYFYPLSKTPLNFLLDKKYLISKIKNIEPILIDNKYLNFRILENNMEINLFFSNKNFKLVGWQTEDIYQNLSVTFISSVEINRKINSKIFILPENN